MDRKVVKKNHRLLLNAQCLRRQMTPQEKHLWYDFLRFYPQKIYKQRIIDDFIVDFYCHKARLVIELDGAHHYTPKGRTYDQLRSEAIEKYGLCILRFSNASIDRDFNGVCREIDEKIRQRMDEEDFPNL